MMHTRTVQIADNPIPAYIIQLDEVYPSAIDKQLKLKDESKTAWYTFHQIAICGVWYTYKLIATSRIQWSIN